jgi:hypothetical protein
LDAVQTPVASFWLAHLNSGNKQFVSLTSTGHHLSELRIRCTSVGLGNFKFRVRGFRLRNSISIVFYWSVISCIKYRCIYFHMNMIALPKHVAAKLNKTVKNYWNRVA